MSQSRSRQTASEELNWEMLRLLVLHEDFKSSIFTLRKKYRIPTDGHQTKESERAWRKIEIEQKSKDVITSVWYADEWRKICERLGRFEIDLSEATSLKQRLDDHVPFQQINSDCRELAVNHNLPKHFGTQIKEYLITGKLLPPSGNVLSRIRAKEEGSAHIDLVGPCNIKEVTEVANLSISRMKQRYPRYWGSLNKLTNFDEGIRLYADFQKYRRTAGTHDEDPDPTIECLIDYEIHNTPEKIKSETSRITKLIGRINKRVKLLNRRNIATETTFQGPGIPLAEIRKHIIASDEGTENC